MECKYLSEQDVIKISEEYYKNDRKKLKYIINNVLRKFGGIENMDDYYSIGDEIFCNALINFNGKGKFNGYLAMCLQRKLYSAVTSNNRKKRCSYELYRTDDGSVATRYIKDISLDAVIESDGADEKCFLKDIIGREDDYPILSEGLFSKNLTRYIQSLPRKTKAIAHMIMDGLDEEDICEKLSMDSAEYNIHLGIMRLYENKKIITNKRR